MADDRLVFRHHAIQQMVTRGITEVEVRDVVENGETLEVYPDEESFPSRLMLGKPEGRPVHVSRWTIRKNA